MNGPGGNSGMDDIRFRELIDKYKKALKEYPSSAI